MFSCRPLIVLALLLLGGCASDLHTAVTQNEVAKPVIDPVQQARYAAIDSEPFPVPAIELRQIAPQYLRQEVAYVTPEPAGTIIVDPANYYLYLVMPEGRAMRYGVGVGREGFGWNGAATINRKAQWPTWTPPAEMVARDPNARPWAKGMPGGPNNPLGARAMYLYQDGRDTLYRIHGTTDPLSIGKSMSSGCIRMLNQDVIDLFGRVPTGSRTIVLAAPQTIAAAPLPTGPKSI
jgi:lipoprotein-anchoring transpeptidase ErfK/SrfK